jgi:hypothetical protein
MPERLSLKLLQHSDLTLFRPYFERNPQAKQKAINLNADIFIDIFYPTLRSSNIRRYRVDLRIFGPGLAEEYPLQRKVLKEQKNWRLDGELVDNPPEEPGRFDRVAAGDLAIISFDGVIPDAVELYIISASDTYDAALHELLAPHVNFGRNSMKEIDLPFIRQIIQQANPVEQHPIRSLLLEDALEDAAQNGIDGIRQLARQVSRRRITAETLHQARENASQIGRTGEELVNGYLAQLQENGEIDEFEWVSDDNAIAPFDFKVTTGEQIILIDVKTTMGQFDNTLHISYNELLQMREAGNYELYRVYDVVETCGILRIVRNMRAFAESILVILEQLPRGIRPDGISVSPEILDFGEPIPIEMSEDE